MPDPRDIRLDIRTTADTSGVEKAADALDHLSAAAGAAPTAAGRPGRRGGGKGAAGNLEEVAKKAPEAAAGSRNAGFAALEAARAFEDMQYGIRGVLNNIPGLVLSLGGTAGIAGAASVAAVAASLLVPKLRDLFMTAEEDSEAVEKLNERLSELREKATAAARAQIEAGNQEIINRYDAGTEALKRQNAEFARSIELVRARRRAEVELIDAQAALDLARIDADGSLDEEGKIRARAGVEQQVAAAKLAAELQEIRTVLDQARQAANQAGAANSGAAGALNESQRRRQLLETEREQLLQRQNRTNRLADLERQQQADQNNLAGLLRAAGFNPAGVDQGAIEALRRQIEGRGTEIDSLRAQGTTSEGDRARLAALNGPDGELAQLTAGLGDLEAKAKAAAEAFKEASRALDAAEELARLNADTARRRFGLENERRGVTTQSGINDVLEDRRREEAKAAEEARRAALRDQEAATEAELQAAAGQLQSTFSTAAGVADSRGRGGLAAQLREIASQAQRRNAQYAELERQLAAALEGFGGEGVATLQTVMGRLSQLEQQLAQIKAQNKNTRTP